MKETTVITVITPITIPSNVSSDRRRLARSEDSAMTDGFFEIHVRR